MRPSVRRPSLAALAVLAFAACGGDDDEAGGGEGRQIAIDAGCAGCHGADGQGGIGPAWTGLFNSTVELDGGGTVTADDAYLQRAITDPAAEIVAGFTVAMPVNQLTPEDVEAIVAYIRSLAEVESG